MANYDLLGNIAIVKFRRRTTLVDKKKFAVTLMKKNKGVKTVLEKISRFKGRLRTLKTKYVAGEKTKEVLYKENNCAFRFNVDTCYFSPRLSTERKEIAGYIKKGERILVMFGGIAPYAIVIAKLSRPSEVISIELSRDCNKYARENVKRNKLENIYVIQGDVKKICPKLKDKFDRIILPRPNLKDDFLNVTFPLIKRNGTIYYYGFYEEDKVNELRELINKEAGKAKRKIKILRIKKAGDIGIRKYRYRADIKLLN